ncbi:MAG: hypothetical protein AB1941_20195 [Gemmatimonadota bacterium]
MTDRDQEQGRGSTGHENDRARLGRTQSDDSPPPGAGVLNSDTAGLSAAENPVLERGRTSGEVLADEALLERDDAGARRADG